MTRYWVIAPVESKSPELFDNVWGFDLANDLISIGWDELGDYSMYSRDQLRDKVANTWPDKPPQTLSLIANMLHSFYHEIKPGDVVVARRGRKILAGIGTVIGTAAYRPKVNPYLASDDYSHSNFLPVKWRSTPRDKAFPTIAFRMPTLSEITEEQFRSLIDDSLIAFEAPEVERAVEDPSTFVLEKYLEEFIVSNFSAIFKNSMRLYVNDDGVEGQQYATDIGSIDILAIDADTNDFVVIELKKGRPSDQVVGQVLRYMGWIKQHMCTAGQGVRGLIICNEPDPKLTYAVSMTSNITIRYYNITFTLNDSK